MEIVGTATEIWCLHWCCTRSGFFVVVVVVVFVAKTREKLETNWTRRRFKKHLCSSCNAFRIWIYYYSPSRCWPKMHFSIFYLNSKWINLYKEISQTCNFDWHFIGLAQLKLMLLFFVLFEWHLRITFQTPKIAMALNIIKLKLISKAMIVLLKSH